MSVILNSPTDVVTRCRHYGACGGCSLQDKSYDAQLGLKTHSYREIVWEWFVRNRAPHSDWDKAAQPADTGAAAHPA